MNISLLRKSALSIVFFIAAGSGCVDAAQKWSGALTLNYRAIGQKPKEVEIEHQMLMSDFYFSLTDDRIKDLPFFIEFSTDLEGSPQLYRVTMNYLKWREMDFTVGRFLIPFGTFNRLYRPDMYYTLTKPVMYATPGLDNVSGMNFPHPMFAAGYVDTGLKVDIHGRKIKDSVFMPTLLSFYYVNGFQEQGRDPLRPNSFIIVAPLEGVDMDWGHERNFLADNNDTKSIGGRIAYHFGNFTIPIPAYPESEGINVTGLSMGVSAMGGKYDIEDLLDYGIYGFDAAFHSGEFSVSGEYAVTDNDFKSRDYDAYRADGTILLIKDRYRLHGAFMQVVFPFPELSFSEQTNFIMSAGRLTRRGPRLILPAGSDSEIGYLEPMQGDIRTRIYKYTGAFNSWMNEHFTVKLEFSYWDFKMSGDIYQAGVGFVLSF